MFNFQQKPTKPTLTIWTDKVYIIALIGL